MIRVEIGHEDAIVLCDAFVKLHSEHKLSDTNLYFKISDTKKYCKYKQGKYDLASCGTDCLDWTQAEAWLLSC